MNSTSPDTGDGGFWRLQHDHLSALLAFPGLCWELVRVFLALADLTLGYGKDRDVVAITQIAERAGMYIQHGGDRLLDTSHTSRAITGLTALGLCGHAPVPAEWRDHNGRPYRRDSLIRWVVWPSQVRDNSSAGNGLFAEPGSTATAGSSSTATGGSRTIADAGSSSTAKTTAKAGRHQDTKTFKNEKDTPPAPSEGAMGTDFDAFWKAYPRKVGKVQARKAWEKAKKKITLAEIMTSIDQQAQSEQWQKDGGLFIPHPATWLNGERWQDEMKTPSQESFN